jgi:hypothetical protein
MLTACNYIYIHSQASIRILLAFYFDVGSYIYTLGRLVYNGDAIRVFTYIAVYDRKTNVHRLCIL